MTNRKSNMGFPSTPRSMTLNCCTVKFYRIFAWLRKFGKQQRLNEWR